MSSDSSSSSSGYGRYQAKVNEVINFQTPVAQPVYQEEWVARQAALKRYTGPDSGTVFHANNLFNALKEKSESGQLTKEAATAIAVASGGIPLSVYNMQADQQDGFKLKYVKGMENNKPVFTDNKEEALKVDGVFFFEDGATVRVFTGYVPAAGGMRTQATVELLTVSPKGVLSQQWVDDNIRGLSTYAFKVDGSEICPAGSWAQYGVNPENKQQLAEIMARCHLLISTA